MNQDLTQLLARNIMLVLAMFCALIGALVASASVPRIRAMPTGQRWSTQGAGLLIILLIWLGVAQSWKINFWLCLVSIFLGMGTTWIVQWPLQIWSDSNGITEFFANLTRAVRAGWKAFNDIKGGGTDASPQP